MSHKAKQRKRMREIVARMQRYWETYPEQPNFADYSDATFIQDALYGIGIAINPKLYEAADGFTRFTEVLRPYVNPPGLTSAKTEQARPCYASGVAGICRLSVGHAGPHAFT